MLPLEAVLVPTRIEEIALIKRNLVLWSLPNFRPSAVTNTEKPRLHFIFNNEDARSCEQDLRNLYSERSLNQYFREISFTYLGLSGLDDLYARTARGPVGPGGYKAGPNNQFFGSMALYTDCPGAIFYMETDCIPIRAGWLDAVSDALRQHQKAFVIGSAYRGKGELPSAIYRHVNGNAIYCIGQPGFDEFLIQWKTWLAEIIANRVPNMAYDILVETVFSMAPEDDRARNFFHKYLQRVQYSDLIQNISSPDDKFLIEPQIVQSILAEHPDTFMAHGALFSQAVDRLFADGGELHPENLIVKTSPSPSISNSSMTKIKRNISARLRRTADWINENEIKYAIFNLMRKNGK